MLVRVMSFTRSRNWLVAAWVVVLFATTSAQAKKTPKAKGVGQGTTERTEFTAEDWQGAYYTLFIPKGISKKQRYPLVIALHGNGSNPDAHLRNLSKVSSKDLPCFVAAPKYQQGGKFNDPRYPRPHEMFKTMMDEIVERHPIDRGRIVVQGFSMGGNYTCSWAYEWATKHPESMPFAALWMSSTAIAPRGSEKAPDVAYLLMTGSKETNVKGLVNVVKITRDAYRELDRRDRDVRYVEIEGMGHSVNATCLQHMREHLASLPSFASASKPVRGAPDAIKPALVLIERGRFKEGLDALAALAGDDSTLEPSLRTKVRMQIAASEKAMAKLPSIVLKQLDDNFNQQAYRWLAREAKALADHATLADPFRRAMSKMKKSHTAELAAYSAFDAARKLTGDERAAAMRALVEGKLKKTAYARRGAQDMQAHKPSP